MKLTLLSFFYIAHLKIENEVMNHRKVAVKGRIPFKNLSYIFKGNTKFCTTGKGRKSINNICMISLIGDGNASTLFDKSDPVDFISSYESI